MGKFTTSQDQIQAIFGLSQWTRHGIPTVMDNADSDSEAEFVRVIPSWDKEGVNLESVAGTLRVDISVTKDIGNRRPAEIGDLLEDFLARKTFGDNTSGVQTQLFSGNLYASSGTKNDARVIYTYIIDFQHYVTGD